MLPYGRVFVGGDFQPRHAAAIGAFADEAPVAARLALWLGGLVDLAEANLVLREPLFPGRHVRSVEAAGCSALEGERLRDRQRAQGRLADRAAQSGLERARLAQRRLRGCRELEHRPDGARDELTAHTADRDWLGRSPLEVQAPGGLGVDRQHE